MEEELSPLAIELITKLVFEETYENIVSELPNSNLYAIADEIKNLISKDIVKPCHDIVMGTSSGFIYDSDRMKDYSFRLTAKGMEQLEIILKE